MRPVPRRFSAVAATIAFLLLPASTASAAPANQRPDTPVSPALSGVGCKPGGISIGTTTPRITAVFGDPDLGTGIGETLTPTFAFWPVGKPAERTRWNPPALTYPGTVFTTLPTALVNGGRYRLAARATDAGGLRSDWSPVCTFTVDTTVPHRPVVESADYPENKKGGGVGMPGRFTLAVAGGDKDVAKFRYSWSTGGLLEVPVDRDGRATVDYTPNRYGTIILTVQAVDHTGNRSSETAYDFEVINHDPRVMQENPDAGIGEPQTLRLWSAVPGTATFTYQLNDGPSATVAADADGRATVIVTPDRRGDNFLTVSSRTASGVESPRIIANLYIAVPVPPPVISSPDFPDNGTPPPTAGREITIFLRTDSPEVAEFVWTTDFGETFQTATADQRGNATVHFTTEDWRQYLWIEARARTADGFESDVAGTGWEMTPAETPSQ